MPQLHQILIIWPHGSQGPGWHGLRHEWLHPSGLGFVHSDSHFRQFAPLWTWSLAFFTRWQSLSQTWLPHGSIRPHLRPQDEVFAKWHGQSEVSWPPRHVTGTGYWQLGQSKFLTSVEGPVLSHGVEAFLDSTLTTTTKRQRVSRRMEIFWEILPWSWQGWGHLWPQFISCWQICLHGGHDPKWQEWGVRDSWWHSGGLLHFCLHFGGLVVLSIPHGTKTRLLPQLHDTSCVSVQG